MRLQRTGLWGHADFLKLWIGQTFSLFGSQISGLAISLTAVLTLGATAGQVGLLRAANFAPPLLLGLITGVWVDRVRRRPILIATNLGSALLLASIPVAALLGVLGIAQLYVVAFLTGTLAVFFRVAYGSYLPSLVGRGPLVDANSKLEMSRSVAQIGGPGLAGALVELLTAPLAIVVDAGVCLVSACFLARIRQPEPAPHRQETPSVVGDMREGLSLVRRHPLLRAMTGSAGAGNFFATVASTVLILFVVRELHLTPVIIGVIFGAIGPGALVGSLLAARLSQRFGLGRTLVGASLLLHSGNLLPALAGGPAALAVAILIAAQFLIGFGAVILNVNLISLSQAITPDRLLGRLQATMQFVTAGTMPLGALTGGILGEALGLRPTLFVGGTGAFLGFFWIFLSPLRTLQEQPESIEEVPDTGSPRSMETVTSRDTAMHPGP